MTFLRSRRGFVFLLSVLAVGVIAAATAASLLLLSGAAELTAYSVQQSLQALEFGRACADRALLRLRADPAYVGGETYQWDRGSCTVHEMGTTGTGPRLLCTEGRSGSAVRRLEINVAQLYPAIVITSWTEVTSVGPCAHASPLAGGGTSSVAASSAAGSSASSSAASSVSSGGTSSASSSVSIGASSSPWSSSSSSFFVMSSLPMFSSSSIMSFSFSSL